LKDWNRAKKIELVTLHNPTWTDLAEGWFDEDDEVRKADSSAPLRNDKQKDRRARRAGNN
jgi:hypothetical protein